MPPYGRPCSWGSDIDLPKVLYVHSFINVDGKKMSKSLGNYVSPDEVIDKYGAEAFRYYFLRHIPSYNDGDFSWGAFEAAYNNELANELGNAVQRTASMIDRYLNGNAGDIPEAQHDITRYEESLADCRFDRALDEVWEQVRGLNQYIDQEKPWVLAKEDDPAHLREVLAYQASSLLGIAKLLEPFLPGTAEKIKVRIQRRKDQTDQGHPVPQAPIRQARINAMELVDTHCHIQSAGLKSGGERITREIWSKASELTGGGMVDSAAKAGATRLICVGCDLEDSRLAIDFAARHKGCWASAGIHPHEAKDYQGGRKVPQFAALAAEPKVVAIGECGLDYHYGHSPKADQLNVLKFQIELALEAGLPLIFHVREAFDDFWPVFDSYGGAGIRGVVHSFTDSSANLDKALERGLYVGVNGIATFTKDREQLNAYKSIPLDRLVLETDAPFLTPTPYRGTINRPERLGAVADFLADLRGEERSEFGQGHH